MPLIDKLGTLKLFDRVAVTNESEISPRRQMNAVGEKMDGSISSQSQYPTRMSTSR